ncbi:MAG: pentapeptide repeat-containing protein [Gammaproteobacteria bacterium]|nr:pentapeptide repeat-containing protein [Gammaproteobacteria bacterium]
MIKHLFIAFTLLLTAPSHADIVSDQIEPISQFAIFNAPVVQVRKTSDPNVAEFYFKPSSHDLIQFSPNQFFRSIPLKYFDRTLFESLFGTGTVPALLTWQGKNGEECFFVNITVNSLNKKQGTLKFNATLNTNIPSVHSSLSGFVGNPIVFGKLKHAVLSVVTQNERVIRSSGSAKTSNIVSNVLRPMTQSPQCVIEPFTVCQYAILSNANLKGADLSNADLTSATLGSADLTGAILTNAILTNAILTNADLTNVEVTGANLTGANLTGANLTGKVWFNVRLTDAIGCSKTTPPLNPSHYGCKN